MKKTYKINTDYSFGISHSGSVYVEGTIEIQLEETEIATLYEIMEKALSEDPNDNLYELDLSYMNLDEIDCDLYERFYDIYYWSAFWAEFKRCVADAYYIPEMLENVDWDHARERCIESYGYKPRRWKHYDEHPAASDKHFRDWFQKKIIRGGDLAAFEREENLLDLDMGEFEFRGSVLLPPALVKEFLADRHRD